MFINEKKNAIELSKKEAKAAAKFGTPEYKALQEARKDYPGFKTVTVATKASAKKDTFKGLTYEFMESYIKAHNEELMTEYLNLRGMSDEAKENLSKAHSYAKMKKWFLKNFPAIKEYHDKCDELLAA